MAQNKVFSFNVMLSTGERDQLGLLAHRLECNASQALRLALRSLVAHVLNNRPTCANGQMCYVPHMHPPAQQYVDLKGQTRMANSGPAPLPNPTTEPDEGI